MLLSIRCSYHLCLSYDFMTCIILIELRRDDAKYVLACFHTLGYANYFVTRRSTSCLSISNSRCLVFNVECVQIVLQCFALNTHEFILLIILYQRTIYRLVHVANLSKTWDRQRSFRIVILFSNKMIKLERATIMIIKSKA